MKPLSKLLVAVDLSKASDAIIDFAYSIAEKYGSELVLFYAVEDSLIDHPAAGFDPNAIISEYVKKAKEYLEQKVEFLKTKGVDAYYVINDTPMDPAQAICKAASEEGASEILIGHKGRGLLKIFPIGSTALSVINLSRTPVILLKVKAEEEKVSVLYRENTAKQDFLKRVLIGVDDNMSDDMVRYFGSLLVTAWRREPGEAYVVHVIESGESEADSKKLVTRAVSILKEYGIEAKTMILEGKPSKAIISAIDQLNVTGLLVGKTLKKKRLHEYITGTTLWRLIAYIDIPMVVYPINVGEE